MKKILISILIIILSILLYMMLAKSISIGSFKIESIEDIKNANSDLDNNFNQALDLSNKTYPLEKSKLETSIKTLTVAKTKYEDVAKYMGEDIDLGATQIKTYKIEFLWTIIGNYANKRSLNLTLDLTEASGDNIYNLNFTLLGDYAKIVSFMYDLESDETLNFKVENFIIAPNGAIAPVATQETTGGRVEPTSEQATNAIEQSTGNSTNTEATPATGGDPSVIKATFTVSDIGITLD